MSIFSKKCVQCGKNIMFYQNKWKPLHSTNPKESVCDSCEATNRWIKQLEFEKTVLEVRKTLSEGL